ncbi:MAG: hypothetical protein K6C13_11375 [Oscillospiraceae bacterium]|nr:hypothetical protein [Oscillospiraceae bacterium]
MTLLLMTTAAVVCTLIWCMNDRAKEMKLGTLCLSYWGAAMMWTVDAIAEYMESGTELFDPPVKDMINDAFLGFAVIVLGLAVWTVRLVLKESRKHSIKMQKA